jgi:hypothetical protein
MAFNVPNVGGFVRSSQQAAEANSLSTRQYGSYSEASERVGLSSPEAAERFEEWLKTYARIRGLKEKEKDFIANGRWLVYSGSDGIKTSACKNNIGKASGQTFGKSREWMCKIDPAIKFTEARYSTLNAQIRVFIEGAEVTPWLEGSVSWSYQSTGGQGTCSFTLNNNNDAFIVTPQNICAGIKNPEGWRLLKGKNSVVADTSPITQNSDESAKFIIYSRKYKVVNPEGGAKAKIDQDGIWFYPLEPMTPVFNKNDCVRVFCRLAHVTGASFSDNGKVIDAQELWVPAWTGFIDQHSTNDDLVSGHRTISIQCYDFRGLLAKMRVRVDHNPTPGNKDDPEGKLDATAKAALSEHAFGCGISKIEYLKLAEKFKCPEFFNVTFWMLNEAMARVEKTQKPAQAKSFFARVDRIIDPVLRAIAGVATGTSITRRDNKIDSKYRQMSDAIACGLGVINAELTAANATAAGNIWTVVYDNGLFVPGLKAGGISAAQSDKGIRDIVKAALVTGGPIDLFCNMATSNLTWETAWDAYVASWSALARKAQQAGGWGNVSNTDKAITARILDDFVAALAAWISSSGIERSTVSGGKVTVDYLMKSFGGQKSATGVWSLPNPSSSLHDDKYLPFMVNTILTYFGTISKGMTPGGKAAVNAAYNQLGGTEDFWNASGVFKHILSNSSNRAIRLTLINTMIEALSNAVFQAGSTLAGLPGKLEAATNAMNIIAKKVLAVQAELLALVTAETQNDLRADGTNVAEAKRRALQYRIPQPGSGDKSSLADVTTKDVSYKEENAGMFADIVRSSGRDAHPLAGLPFELAVEWLCMTNTKVWKGFRVNVGTYGDNTLSDWNKTALFGVYGRPLTYQEVTIMGRGTFMEVDKKKGAFSPIQPFLHILLPKNGTGAMTIVQQHIQANTSTSAQFRYETRLAMLNEICELLDYQFYVSPVGDLVFEFPHYNAIPSDFGPVFRGAYTISKDVQTSKIGHETGPMYSAWILQGMEVDAGVGPVADTPVASQMKKEIIVLENVARRLGANPRYINLKIPGVGANVQMEDRAGLGTPKQQLLAYAYLAIQRDIGKSESISVDHPYRPYLLPNRPFWVVHRQRIGLISSAEYSVQVHKGDTTTRTELGYIRKLFRDGTYRNAAGGWRMPVDYSGINAGSVPTIMKFGAGNTKGPAGGGGAKEAADLAKLWAEQNHGVTTPSAGAPSKCGPALKNAWIMAGANYDDALSGLSGSAAAFRISRDELWTENPGDKSAAYNEDGSGFTSQEPRKKTTPFTGFKNPFAFGLSVGRNIQGEKTKIGMDNFGFIGRGGDDPYHTSQSMHPGIDIPVQETATHYVVAPIPLNTITAGLSPFKGGKTKVTSKINWQKFKGVAAWKPFLSTDDAGPYYVDRIHKAINERNPDVPVGSFGVRGLWVSGYGWITLPDNPDAGKILCRLTYMHLKDMVYPSVNFSASSSFAGVAKRAVEQRKNFYGGNLKTCPANTKLAVAGCSGNAISAHLHFNLEISYTNWQGKVASDTQAFEAARKATLEYLRATLLARITNGYAGGALENGKVSDSWRAAMQAKGLTNMSMADALKFAENMVADELKRYLVPLDQLKGNYQWTLVNPYLFFAPEQLVDPLPRAYTESIKDKDHEVDVATVCGQSSGAAVAQMERDARKCLQDVIAMPHGAERETALSRCKAMVKSNKELLALQPSTPASKSEALARMMAEKLNKPGAGAVAPAK